MKLTWKQLIPYAIIVVLMIIASFYDYQINERIANALYGIDIFFERFAILPLMMLLIACFELYYQLYHQKIFILFTLIASIYAGFDTMHYWMDGMLLYLFGILFAFILNRIIHYIVKCIPSQYQVSVAHWFMYFTMVFLLSILCTSILKTLWGRIRFRDGQGINDFTPWYFPQGINGNHSFPSGHTTAWTSILCFLHVLPKRSIAWWNQILIYALIILMPLTRMSCGAHYLSDTLIGFTITYTIYLMMSYIYQKRRIL